MSDAAPPPDDRDLAGSREQLAAAERRICAWDYLKVLVEPDLDDLHLFVQEYDRRGEELAENVGVMNALRRHRDTAEVDLAAARDRIAALESVAGAVADRWSGDFAGCSADPETTRLISALAAAVRALTPEVDG